MLKKNKAFQGTPLLLLTLVIGALGGCSSSGSGGSGQSGNASLNSINIPPKENYDTAEYRENWGLNSISAISAYNAGYTGRGIKVAVIDTGVDVDNPELKPNLDPESTNIVSGNAADLQDTDGHGTAVSGVVAAVHNGTGTEGVAFDATLLAIGAVDKSSCSTDCSFYQSDIANAIDYGRLHGAKIVNLSMGGPAMGATLIGAVQRAVQAGMILVIAAGNDAATAPSGFAQIADASWANGQIIIAGASDQLNNLASFSDQAGNYEKNFFVVAPGVNIETTHLGGGLALASGTSFSAPAVAGAMALLLQEFPNLSARDAVNILLTSATDLGATGVDTVFGRGLINLAKAIEPIGAASIPTSSGDISAISSSGGALNASAIHLSPAFGDALASSKALAGAVFLDSYQRSFHIDLTQHIRRDQTLPDLESLTEPGQKSFSRDIMPKPGMHFEFSADVHTAFSEIDQQYFANADPRSLHRPTLRWRFTEELGKTTSLVTASHMAITEGDDADSDGLFLNRPENQNIATGRPDDLTMGLLHQLGRNTRLTMSVTFNHLKDDLYQLDGKQTSVTTQIRQALGQHFGLTLNTGVYQEKGAVLGALSGGALSLGNGATTTYLGIAAHWRLSPKFGFFASYMSGSTRVNEAPDSLFTDVSRLESQSFRAGFVSSGLFGAADRFGFSFSQPLRVMSGQANILMATDRDYRNNRLTLTNVNTSLAPSGRELDLEASYQTPLEGGIWLESNILRQINAGNIAGGPSQTLAILRLSAGF